ncbi:endo-1,4-beta-xylanase [Confluentibacter citreus]|uniref:endo-1,4-beta-xylanase n=1 Tax=Confluentibacter citreus TaxID=2007307 RepID=UPI000C28BDB4|nr:endo-1,4-beta-xylanase [Confluentibacter citreus]
MKLTHYLIIIIATLLISCSGSGDDDPKANPIPVPTPSATLKASANFPIGNIVSASKLSGTDTYFRTLLNKEFNSITAENDMKMGAMFTGPDTYDFSKGDAIVNYAKTNGLRVHGHALVWHASIPNWLKNYTGTDAEFEAQVKGYIKATVAHFAAIKTTEGKSVLESWDVVNEHFTSDAAAAVFNTRMGSDYVSKCFIWAREADADVKLFYNDYNLESQNSKAAQVVDMVNTFKTNLTPIDGIGMQMHIDYQYPDLTTLSNNLTLLKNTGLLIHLSELDMTVNKDKALTSLTTNRANAQKEKYKQVATMYNTLPAAQRFGITFWGMRDNDSWLINFHNNQNEWPLLFDSNYNYKQAFIGFLEGLNN